MYSFAPRRISSCVFSVCGGDSTSIASLNIRRKSCNCDFTITGFNVDFECDLKLELLCGLALESGLRVDFVPSVPK